MPRAKGLTGAQRVALDTIVGAGGEARSGDVWYAVKQHLRAADGTPSRATGRSASNVVTTLTRRGLAEYIDGRTGPLRITDAGRAALAQGAK